MPTLPPPQETQVIIAQPPLPPPPDMSELEELRRRLQELENRPPDVPAYVPPAAPPDPRDNMAVTYGRNTLRVSWTRTSARSPFPIGSWVTGTLLTGVALSSGQQAPVAIRSPRWGTFLGTAFADPQSKRVYISVDKYTDRRGVNSALSGSVYDQADVLGVIDKVQTNTAQRWLGSVVGEAASSAGEAVQNRGRTVTASPGVFGVGTTTTTTYGGTARNAGIGGAAAGAGRATSEMIGNMPPELLLFVNAGKNVRILVSESTFTTSAPQTNSSVAIPISQGTGTSEMPVGIVPGAR
jgi:hypothetical protein